MSISNQEAISIGTERFLENNKDLVMAAIERGAAKASMAVADSVGILVAGKVERFLAANRADIVGALKTMVAADGVISNLRSRRREEPAFDISKQDG